MKKYSSRSSHRSSRRDHYRSDSRSSRSSSSRSRRRRDPTGRSSKSGRSSKGIGSATERIEKARRKMKHKRSRSGLNAKSAFYIKNLRFLTPKPTYKIEPKLYKSNISDESLYKYASSVLELKHKKRLHTGVTLGLGLDFLTKPQKNVVKIVNNQQEKKKHHPKDMILLGHKVENIEEDQTKEEQVSWLRKTEYITTQKHSFDRSGNSQNINRISFQQKNVKFNLNKSFEEVKEIQKYIPKKKKKRKIKNVYDVYPDFELWRNKYVNITFNNSGRSGKRASHYGGLGTKVLNYRNGLFIQSEKNKKDLSYYEKDETSQLILEDNSVYEHKQNFSIIPPNKGYRKSYDDDATQEYFLRFPKGEKVVYFNKNNKNIHVKKKSYQRELNSNIANGFKMHPRKKTAEENAELKRRMLEIGMSVEDDSLDIEMQDATSTNDTQETIL